MDICPGDFWRVSAFSFISILTVYYTTYYVSGNEFAVVAFKYGKFSPCHDTISYT